MSLRITVSARLALGLLATLTGLAAQALPVTLADENFDDVSGLNATTVRSIAQILATTPSELPAGISASSPVPGWVNVRRHDEAIDATGGISANTFDNFFSAGQFAVLGDFSGDLGGTATGVSTLSIPFIVPLGATSLSIRYDWVFDLTAASNADRFVVDVLSAGASLAVQAVAAPVRGGLPGATRGLGYNVSFDAAQLAALSGATSLRFQLTEFQSGGSSAVGLDNITIVAETSQTLPEPAMLLVSGAALLAAWRALRRR